MNTIAMLACVWLLLTAVSAKPEVQCGTSNKDGYCAGMAPWCRYGKGDNTCPDGQLALYRIAQCGDTYRCAIGYKLCCPMPLSRQVSSAQWAYPVSAHELYGHRMSLAVAPHTAYVHEASPQLASQQFGAPQFAQAQVAPQAQYLPLPQA